MLVLFSLFPFLSNLETYVSKAFTYSNLLYLLSCTFKFFFVLWVFTLYHLAALVYDPSKEGTLIYVSSYPLPHVV